MFNLEVRVDDFGGHAVVALDGDLDLADVPGVASDLIAVGAACGPSVIVDMTGLEFIDCCGLGMLVRVLKWARARGGDLSLVAPQDRVRRLLSLTGLLGVFSVYPSVEQAVRGPKLVQLMPDAASRRLIPSRQPVLASAGSWRRHRERPSTGRCGNPAGHPLASRVPGRLAMIRWDRHAWPPWVPAARRHRRAWLGLACPRPRGHGA
jgi:anti-sigma B factor antagonist